MREIKFRAWNKVFKRFVPVACLYFNESSNFIGVYMGDETEEEWTAVRKEHLELMQYTGRKDMNDVEVWEGDIVAMDLLEGRTFFKVIYSEDYARFCFRDIDNEDWFIGKNNSYFVVGNIYENPELLEVRP